MLTLITIVSAILGPFVYILLQLDAFLYQILGYIYQIFLFVAEAQIFNNDKFIVISSRVYTIIGIIMLFVIAIALLNSIVDPDKASKDNNGLAEKIVTTIVLLALCPTAFNYLYKFQHLVVKSGIIGDVIFGDEAMDIKVDSCVGDGSYISNEVYNKDLDKVRYIGYSIATDIFKIVFHPAYVSESQTISEENVNVSSTVTDNSNSTEDYQIKDASEIENSDRAFLAFLGGFSGSVTIDKWVLPTNGGNILGGIFNALTAKPLTLCEAYQLSQTTGNFQNYKYFATNVVDGDITYTYIISTIVAGICIYLFISFSLDLGVRAVKLGYLQLIAPVAIMLRIVPKQDKIFQNWLKKILSTYFELFVRIFVVYLGIYLITNLPNIGSMWDESGLTGASFAVTAFAWLIIVLGILTFMKQAPKLFGEVLGIDSGNLKLGIKDKLKDSGIFRISSAVGGGVTSAVRNTVATGSPLSGAAGFVSGARNGWKEGKDAKSFGDTAKAAGKASNAASEARIKREAYNAEHGGGFYNGMLGHLNDAKNAVINWPKDDAAQYAYYQEQQKKLNAVKEKNKAVTDAAKEEKDKRAGDITLDGTALEKYSFPNLAYARTAEEQKKQYALNHSFEDDFRDELKEALSGISVKISDYKTQEDYEKAISDRETIKATYADNAADARRKAIEESNLLTKELKIAEGEINKKLIGTGGEINGDGKYNEDLIAAIKALKTSLDSNGDAIKTSAIDNPNIDTTAIDELVKKVSIESLDNHDIKAFEMFAKNSKDLKDAIEYGNAKVTGKMNEISENRRAKEEKK